ncbi:MAG: UDP-2,3-diacylglucosamine diphosphatase LpxI [Octadecabacter sp.]|nr:UDP-2,3-diacylglucosamine diphosphatase LpxI [Octadecabacter sp.]
MTLALIAGLGGLPIVLAASLQKQGRSLILCEMYGFVSKVTGDFHRIPFRFETLGTFLSALKKAGVTEVCMAGEIQRPKVDPSFIDAATMPLVPRLMAAMAKGDDGTLSAVVALFEEYGFSVVGAHDIAPELLPMPGFHTRVEPPDLTNAITAAEVALIDMGQMDLGQALLLQGSEVIAREDGRGTAAMLKDLQTQGNGLGVTLFKAPKPNQNMRVDMPLIGPDTAKQVVDAGLAGIVIPYGVVMVLDLPQIIITLDMHGLFLWVTH